MTVAPLGAGLLLDSFVLVLGYGPSRRLPKADDRSERARHREEELKESEREAK